MKICWDNLEGVFLTKNGKFVKGTSTYSYKEKCSFCGEPYLTQIKSIFCGRSCAMINDLTGQRFGRWKVLKFVEVNNGMTLWKCVCKCGTIKNVAGNSMIEGKSKSCGCLNIEKIKSRSGKNSPVYKHGKSGTNPYACELMQRRNARKLKQTPENRDKKKIQLYYTICAYLNKRLAKTGWHVDHIQPLSKGGLHHEDNLQILSVFMNIQKHDKYPLTEEEKVKYKGIRI